MRVMVLGAGGQVGAELVRYCRLQGDEVEAYRHRELDIQDGNRLREVVRAYRPDVVFNGAAYTRVDAAESDVEAAEAANHRGPLRLAGVCRDMVTRLVHYSTDYVFDGTARHPMPEDHPTKPLGVYGRTKLAGEQAVLRSGADAFVVRTSWVFGLDGPNFISTVLRLTRERGEMRVVDDQRGSPTWARDLAVASRRLVEVGDPGLYHLTNSGDCTWFELARRVVEIAGVEARLEPISTAEYPTPAARPAYSVLANARWAELGQPPLRHWSEAVAEFVPELLARPN